MYHLNLGADFVAENKLQAGIKYPILIRNLADGGASGTLQKTYVITGLAKLYRNFKLKPEIDQVFIEFVDGTVVIIPPAHVVSEAPEAEPPKQDDPGQPAESKPLENPPVAHTVFARQQLKHIHIPEFAPANLFGWSPETEVDVFLVFGKLAELTDYRYCCGASKGLLDKLGYKAQPKIIAGSEKNPKPDSILIDRATDEYLVSEFKMNSADFKGNHSKEDVDVLICWIDDETDRSVLPNKVLSLKTLRENAVKNGDIEVDALS